MVLSAGPGTKPREAGIIMELKKQIKQNREAGNRMGIVITIDCFLQIILLL